MILRTSRITGRTGRPGWRSSILNDSARSSFAALSGITNFPQRAVRRELWSCGKRSADSTFPTSVHSRCYTPSTEPTRAELRREESEGRSRRAERVTINQVSTKPREAQLAVSYIEGRKHLPVIELRRAA